MEVDNKPWTVYVKLVQDLQKQLLLDHFRKMCTLRCCRMVPNIIAYCVDERSDSLHYVLFISSNEGSDSLHYDTCMLVAVMKGLTNYNMWPMHVSSSNEGSDSLHYVTSGLDVTMKQSSGYVTPGWCCPWQHDGDHTIPTPAEAAPACPVSWWCVTWDWSPALEAWFWCQDLLSTCQYIHLLAICSDRLQVCSWYWYT